MNARTLPAVAACVALGWAVTTGAATRVQTSPLGDAFGRWWPDGQAIAFASDRTGDPEIYRMARDGSGLRQLTDTPGRDAHPDVAPDGTRIVFQSPRGGEDTHIYLMAADGSDPRRLTSLPGFSGVPVWSPDGTRIAFQRTAALGKSPWHLYLVSSDGSGLVQLTAGAASDQVPHWTRDGRRLLFHSDRSGSNQLYEIDVTSRDVRRVHASAADDTSGTYSPDQAAIVFISVRDGRRAIHQLDVATGRDRHLIDVPAHQPSFSPDGQLLLFHALHPEGSRLYIARRDGSDVSPLIAGRR